ncbi:MAG: hypothetical protein HY902_04815 [Deltaproteobacteria bacterium]|nr:hypothetical protein [Deltaproteobacteria bacterium]
MPQPESQVAPPFDPADDRAVAELIAQVGAALRMARWGGVDAVARKPRQAPTVAPNQLRQEGTQPAAQPRVSQGGPASRPAAPGPAVSPLAQLAAVSRRPQAQAALETLAAEAAECARCPRREASSRVVFGSGNPVAKTMILLGSPGAAADATGKVGQGEAGALLDKMVGAIGLHRDDAWFTHVCLCHGGGARPTAADTRTCSTWLTKQWEVVQPKALLAFGEVPAQFLLRQALPLAQLRGKWFEIRGVPALCTWSPEELLAEPARKREAWADLQSFMNHLGLRRP